MIIDGKKLAEHLEIDLAARFQVWRERGIIPTLAIVAVNKDHAASAKYVDLKQTIGKRLGVEVKIFDKIYPSTEELRRAIDKLNRDPAVHGIIVQLPLPVVVQDSPAVTALISADKDVDALSGHPKVLSPVVRAIAHIFDVNHLRSEQLAKMKLVVVGEGRLVGQPVAEWLRSIVGDGNLTVVKKDDSDLNRQEYLRRADLIVSGAGVPNLINSTDIKKGVILIDASTSDVGGQMVGDIHPDCAAKAKLFTPVPGGVGPLTVRMLFANLLELLEKQNSK